MKNSAVKGGILVAIGAASYGVMTTFVKLAINQGYNVLELSFSQYVIGLIGLFALEYFYTRKKPVEDLKKPTGKNIRNLLLAGTSFGFTSVIYYFSVQYVSVSIAIVLLMQSVWIGVILDFMFNKIKPGPLKITAVGIILIGTVLATNLLFDALKIDWRGIALGFLAAISYSFAIFTSNRVALNVSSLTRSKWMATGGGIVVFLISSPFIINSFHPEILIKWGLILGLFGTVLPPLMLASGMPKINLGIGSIITAIELPVAVSMAYFVINEQINLHQWSGILLILIAVVLMNLRKT